mgnify:CR=1 FL=1
MKKKMLISIIAVVTVLFTGCTNVSDIIDDTAVEINENPIEHSIFTRDYGNVYIYTDPETGVEYLIFSKSAGYAGMGGITPRLNEDGSLYINPDFIEK